jgi:hypothetical protein
VELAKDWRSDCLENQNQLVVELCGVLIRLHSSEGLAQTNNNAKLNNSVEHIAMLLETSAKAEENNGKTFERGHNGGEKRRCPGKKARVG